MAKLKNLIFFIFYFLLIPFYVSAQTLSLDAAIAAACSEIAGNLKQGSRVAVINIKSPSEQLSKEVIVKLQTYLMQTKMFYIVERNELELIRKEQNFQLSGEVSDETMLSISNILSAPFIITGSFETSETFWIFFIKILNVESGKIEFVRFWNVKHDQHIQFFAPGVKLINTYFWSLGFSAGSAFVTPGIIATVHGTIAPINLTFLEFGCDMGFITNISNTKYFSVCPFVHLSVLLPIDYRNSAYIGAGGAYMYSDYRLDDIHETPSCIMMDVVTGFVFFNFLDISYTLRTNFNNFINKASLGYIYRF